MDDEKAMEWAKKPSWSLAEAEFLLFGLEARKADGSTWSFFPIASNAGYTTDWFMRDIGASNLVRSCAVNGVDAYRPADLVASAKRGNIGLWQVWEEYLQSHIQSGTKVVSSNWILGQTSEEIRKRAALVSEVVNFWPSVDRDLRDASRNGLSEMAKHSKNTFWKVSEALNWAGQRGKLVKGKAQVFVSGQPDSSLSPMLRALLNLD